MSARRWKGLWAFQADVVAAGGVYRVGPSANYIDPTNEETVDFQYFPDKRLPPGRTNTVTILLPAGRSMRGCKSRPTRCRSARFPTNVIELSAGPQGLPTCRGHAALRAEWR